MTQTGKRMVWGHTLGGSERWLDAARDANVNGPRQGARVIHGPDMAAAIDRNLRAVRTQAFNEAILWATARLAFYEGEYKREANAYWLGTIDTAKIVVAELAKMRDRAWAAEEDAPASALDGLSGEADDTVAVDDSTPANPFTIKVPV